MTYQLLHQASELTTFMTAEEHGITTKYATIYLLGYLLPSMTGNRQFYGAAAASYATVVLADGELQQRKRMRTSAASNPTGGADGSNAATTSDSERSSVFNSDAILNLSLEELLEICVTIYTTSSSTHAPGGCCTDERLTASFRRFVQYGLGSFLSSRAAHPNVVDLIHVLSMAISPAVVPPSVQTKGGGSDANEPNRDWMATSPSYQRAVRLMQCPQAHSFQLTNANRLQLVRMVASCFVAPAAESLVANEGGEDGAEEDPGDQSEVASGTGSDAQTATEGQDSPIIDGALVHLRLALETFATGSLSVYDASFARQALGNIAITSGHVPFVEETAKRLVGMLTDCRNVCRCNERSAAKDNEMACSYASGGKQLSDLILRHNGSRHYADESFGLQALILISGAVDRLTRSMMKSESGMGNPVAASACQICALLGAAKTLIYFLNPPKSPSESGSTDGHNSPNGTDTMETDKSEVPDANQGGDGNEAKESLLRNSVLLLDSPDLAIVREAASLLSLAFAYFGVDCSGSHVSGVLSAIRCCFQRPPSGSSGDKQSARITCKKRMMALQGVISVLSRQSPAFAITIMSNIFNEDTTPGEPILYVASSIALSQPRVVAKYLEFLYLAVEENADQEKHLIAIYMSCRLAHYFSSEERVKSLRQRIKSQLEDVADPWTLFQLARHAFCTANFGIAEEIITNSLLARGTSEHAHLFYVTTRLLAQAEHTISETGAMGIPQALPSLQSAKSHLRSLQRLAKADQSTGSDFSFQLELISCRIDFINLCVTLRGLCGEMRLVNAVPGRATRTRLHQRNMMHCFYLLSSRYAAIYRRYGIYYCQQTRTSLRTLSALCRFLARASAKTFVESSQGQKSRIHEFHETDGAMWPEGDASHPVTRMISKFSSSVLWSMDENVEPNVRAAAMMEMLDPVLMCPLPTPRGYFSPKHRPSTTLRLSGDPEDVSTDYDVDSSEPKVSAEAEVVKVPPGEPITLYATGTISQKLQSAATLPFSQVVAWHKISYDGPLITEDEVYGEDNQDADLYVDTIVGTGTGGDGEILTEAPHAAPVRSDGKFSLPVTLEPITKEGYYMVKVTLGCRDARCGEFEIPVADDCAIIAICVTAQAFSDEP